MTTRDDRPAQFKALIDEITAAENALRGRFQDTPVPSPQVLDRIKARLTAEAVQLTRTGRPRTLWFAWASATAAAILLAISAGLYFRTSMQLSPTDQAAVGAPPAQVSLDAFAASLPKVMTEEDPAVRELDSDMQDLESQAASSPDSAQSHQQPSATGTSGTPEGQDLARTGWTRLAEQEYAWQPVTAADGSDA